MTSHSRPFLDNRPSLCSYCLRPVGGLLFNWGDRGYGACSTEHLDKIKHDLELNDENKRGDRGVSLKFAQVNHCGVEKAVTKSRDKYLELAKQGADAGVELSDVITKGNWRNQKELLKQIKSAKI